MDVVIISEYKRDTKGKIVVEDQDPESGKPFVYIELDTGGIEVFFDGEYRKVE